MTTTTLIFDNGPEPDATPQVLDNLRRHSIRATFFVVGQKMQERRLACTARRASAETRIGRSAGQSVGA